MRLLAALLAMLALGACNTWPTLESRAAMLAPDAQYHQPANIAAGALAPLVIMVSGCGGLVGEQGPKPMIADYAGAATRAGAYVVVPDSFRPRGIDFETSVSQVCSGLRLRGQHRAGDILAAEELARRRWGDVFTTVIIAGWSHGGWAVTELLNAPKGADGVGNFRIDRAYRSLDPDAVALFYPYCGFLSLARYRTWAFDGPLLLVTAELDNRSTTAQCLETLEHARGGSQNLQSVVIPGATHAFDEPDQIAGSEFRYDAARAAESHALFERFIREQAAAKR